MAQAKIMAIINVSEDSFSGDGNITPKKVLANCQKKIAQGADILDIGAESSRPGAISIPLELEWQRLAPIIKELINWQIPISVDTYKPEIMQKALDLGVDIINDINGFRAQNALEILAQSKACGVIMHMQGTPATMQILPKYIDVNIEVQEFFGGRRLSAYELGIPANRLIFDPGFGFGKSFEHNQVLFKNLPQLAQKFSPILVGISRKSMLGIITGKDVENRLAATIAGNVLAIIKGAKIIRVHDVSECVDCIKVINQLTN